MHKGHLAGCAVALMAVLAYVAFVGPSSGGIGLLVAVLACPIAMIVAMRFIIGDHDAGHDRPRRTAEPLDQPSPR